MKKILVKTLFFREKEKVDFDLFSSGKIDYTEITL
jgi:hypothetical protein